MAGIRITQTSQDALKARLVAPEGKEALNKLVRLIADSVVEVMPPELLESLDTEEGMAAFRGAWPDIVNAFFSGCGTKPAVSAGKRKGARRTTKRRRAPEK